MADNLQYYLLTNNLLVDNQSGFRSNHSCETSLLNLVNFLQNSIDKNQLISLILLDFRKAFDIIDHDLLLLKLELYRIKGKSLNLFKSYLSGRKQHTFVNNVYSNSDDIVTGVPQGSILGPILFSLFINDLPFCISNAKVDMYADDTTVSITHHNIYELEKLSNEIMSNVYDWCTQNCLVSNESKTKYMLMMNNQKRASLKNPVLNINLGSCKITQTKNEKLLGVHLDENLNWNVHINKLCEKLTAKLLLFKRLKVYMGLPTRVLFYNAYIFSIMSYCCCVWGLQPSTSIDRIFKFQKRYARQIFDKPFDFPHELT